MNDNMKGVVSVNDFIKQLSSSSPVPGGGGASALVGGIGVALCSMVANLTSGKKKYEEYQSEIETVLKRTDLSIQYLLDLVEKDAEVFEPLAQAYGIPKDNPISFLINYFFCNIVNLFQNAKDVVNTRGHIWTTYKLKA